MGKKDKTESLPEIPIEPEPEPAQPVEAAALTSVDDKLVRNLLRGMSNRSGAFVRSIAIKRTLTKPLKAMAHEHELVFTALSEMYTMELPVKGRSTGLSLARVIDGINVMRAEECTLICNAMMVSALKRGGFSVFDPVYEDGVIVSYKQVDAQPLQGKSFVFEQGLINEEKGYRVVTCAEAQIEF